MNNVRWTPPEPGPNGTTVRRYIVGKAVIGSVMWASERGPFYAMSQLRRYGASGSLRRAMDLVEMHALNDVLTYPIMGNS